MKNFFLLVLCASLFLVGCEKDDGFRTVMIELEMDAIPMSNSVGENSVNFDVRLFSPDGGAILLRFGGDLEQGDQSQTYKSDEIALAVGSNVIRYISLEGSFNNDTSLPCDVTLRIKADNKVIWSHKGKKGDYYFNEQANLIVR